MRRLDDLVSWKIYLGNSSAPTSIQMPAVSQNFWHSHTDVHSRWLALFLGEFFRWVFGEFCGQFYGAFNWLSIPRSRTCWLFSKGLFVIQTSITNLNNKNFVSGAPHKGHFNANWTSMNTVHNVDFASLLLSNFSQFFFEQKFEILFGRTCTELRPISSNENGKNKQSLFQVFSLNSRRTRTGSS